MRTEAIEFIKWVVLNCDNEDTEGAYMHDGIYYSWESLYDKYVTNGKKQEEITVA